MALVFELEINVDMGENSLSTVVFTVFHEVPALIFWNSVCCKWSD